VFLACDLPVGEAERVHRLRLVTGAGLTKQGTNELVAAVGLDPGFQVGIHPQLIPAVKLWLGVGEFRQTTSLELGALV
jgi:hypothetical protein